MFALNFLLCDAPAGGGLFATSLAHSVTMVYLTYGVGIGVGIALVYSPSIACVQPWFMRQRGRGQSARADAGRRGVRPHRHLWPVNLGLHRALDCGDTGIGPIGPAAAGVLLRSGVWAAPWLP